MLVVAPDLSAQFILVHPRRQCGIVEFLDRKTKAKVRWYRFDEDGDMHLGRLETVPVQDLPKGKGIQRQSHRMYLHDFICAPGLPNA